MGPGFCEVCGGYIGEGQTFWRLEYHQDGAEARGPEDVAVLGSMECFVRFAVDMAEHYANHVEQGSRGNGHG